MKKLLLLIIIVSTIKTLSAQTSFTYNFGTATGTFPLALGSSIRSNQTATTPELLDPDASQVARIRLSSSTGNPGSFDLVNTGFAAAVGSSLKIKSTDNSAINKFSIYNIAGTNVFSLQFNIRFGAGAAGTYLFSIGNDGGSATGTDFYSNSSNLPTDATAKSFATLRWTLGASTHTFAARAGTTYSNVSTTVNPTINFTANSEHKIEIYCNNSGTAGTYTRGGTGYNIGANNWQIWLNNTRLFISTGVADFTAGDLPSSTALNAFLFNSYGSSDNADAFLDNFLYADYLANLTVLPVSLTSFTAQKQVSGVQLKWNTSSEQNNSHFDIQRSADGINFSNVGKVNGAGNSNTSLDYYFTDKSPASGTNYYRLSQVDFDGKISLSKPVFVNTGFSNSSIKVSSSSNSSNLNISISSDRASSGLLIIYNVGGQKVFEQAVSLDNGNNDIAISLPNTDKGVFVATYSDGTQVLKSKFIR